MAAELADAASCSSDTTAPDPVPAALFPTPGISTFVSSDIIVSKPLQSAFSLDVASAAPRMGPDAGSRLALTP